MDANCCRQALAEESWQNRNAIATGSELVTSDTSYCHLFLRIQMVLLWYHVVTIPEGRG